MDPDATLIDTDCSLAIPSELYQRLHAHLFPGDGEEHGAVILAGTQRSERGLRFLARELFLAQDGVDFVSSTRGHRKLRGEFITPKILVARDQGLCYLAIHNHGGNDRVGFSRPDLDSHERGYSALLDVARGNPVGALVVAPRAIAADIWLSKTQRVPVTMTRVLGTSLERLYPAPPLRPSSADETYDRQARLFGDTGQDLLRGGSSTATTSSWRLTRCRPDWSSTRSSIST